MDDAILVIKDNKLNFTNKVFSDIFSKIDGFNSHLIDDSVLDKPIFTIYDHEDDAGPDEHYNAEDR